MAISIFLSEDFEKKEREKGGSCPSIFGHLKRALELLISVQMSHLEIF